VFGITSAHAVVVDQENLPDQSWAVNTQSAFEWQQQIIAGQTGILSGIDIFTQESPGTFSFFVNTGLGWQTDTPEFETTISPAAFSTIHIDVSSAGISLSAGTPFMMGIVGAGPGTICCGVRGTQANAYPAGALYLDGSVRDNDLGFRTYMQVVPIPPAVWLFGSGLIGLVGIARRRRKAA